MCANCVQSWYIAFSLVTTQTNNKQIMHILHYYKYYPVRSFVRSLALFMATAPSPTPWGGSGRRTRLATRRGRYRPRWHQCGSNGPCRYPFAWRGRSMRPWPTEWRVRHRRTSGGRGIIYRRGRTYWGGPGGVFVVFVCCKGCCDIKRKEMVSCCCLFGMKCMKTNKRSKNTSHNAIHILVLKDVQQLRMLHQKCIVYDKKQCKRYNAKYSSWICSIAYVFIIYTCKAALT